MPREELVAAADSGTMPRCGLRRRPDDGPLPAKDDTHTEVCTAGQKKGCRQPRDDVYAEVCAASQKMGRRQPRVVRTAGRRAAAGQCPPSDSQKDGRRGTLSTSCSHKSGCSGRVSADSPPRTTKMVAAASPHTHIVPGGRGGGARRRRGGTLNPQKGEASALSADAARRWP